MRSAEGEEEEEPTPGFVARSLIHWFAAHLVGRAPFRFSGPPPSASLLPSAICFRLSLTLPTRSDEAGDRGEQYVADFAVHLVTNGGSAIN